MHDRLAEDLVRLAMEEAVFAVADGNPPFGAVLVDAAGDIVTRAHNTQVSGNDPTAHAEINALRAGGALRGSPDLAGWCLVVNAEPCSMCASAIVKAGIAELVYGAPHEPHLDPYLPVADVLARAAWPPRITALVLAEECAAQIAAARGATDGPPID
jgi:tRNA(adenine34) deaminase